MSNIIEEKENRERLLKNVKKECKQLMEIAVTKKFINEDNSCITTLCATIESCVLHGLRRRAIGLFRTNTTLFILQKLSKSCEQAKQILDLCEEYEKAYCSKNSINQNKALCSANSQQSLFSRKTISSSENTCFSFSSNQLVNGRNFSPIYSKGSNCYRFLWIRIALLNKCLIKIIDHLIEDSANYYYPYALLADPVDGPIFSSLLIGPCALEYTQMKSCEHIWNDPNADELVQRHRMHSSANSFTNAYGIIYNQTGTHSSNSTANVFNNKYKLGLNSSFARRKASISTALDDISNLSNDKFFPAQTNTSNYFASKDSNQTSPQLNNQTNSSINYSAKEYVESLHQNSKSQIIYGKNHVMVIQREKDIAGYLSLHLTSNGLVLKWTPNQIMNGCNSLDDASVAKNKTGYWDYALNIDFNTIVYLHCHQQASSAATIVLVAQDGVQYPPIIFPKGSHLLQFLTCLETGLAPNGQLDPALWNDDGKGKIFPKIPRKTIKKQKSDTMIQTESLDEIEESQEDFVFRIINSKSNVTMVNSEPASRRKLEFSLSAGDKSGSGPNAIFFEKMSYNKSRIGFLLSSFGRKNSSLDESQQNNEAKILSPSLKSQFSVFSSVESNPSSISPSSIILDKTSINGFHILSKVENIQQHSINNFEIFSNELNLDNLTTLKQISSRSSLRTLCDNMRKQILCRAFYGWLAYHRHLKTITTHLIGLVNTKNEIFREESDAEDTEYEIDNKGNKINIGKYYLLNKLKLDEKLWLKWIDNEKKINRLSRNKGYFYKIVYLNGIENSLRKQIWPFLLDHYKLDMNEEERLITDKKNCDTYFKLIEEWKPFEELINTKDQKKLAVSLIAKSQNTENLNEKIENKISTCLTKHDIPTFDMNKKSTIKTSLFGFSMLKQKPKPLVTVESLKNEVKILDKSKNLLRKDSSLSNDVFVENESAFSFSLSKFSAKSLLNKLMSRNSEDIDTVSCSILGQKKELTDDECRAFAVEIVNNMLNKIQNDWDVLSQDEMKKEDDDSIGTFRTGSVYTDTRNFLSNATSFSNDEIFHDVETNEFDQLNEKIPFYDCEPIKELKKDSSGDAQIDTNFGHASVRRTLSNQEIIENFALNMHRIDKDVTRCDRNYWYFTSNENLKKLKNIMYTFVWENLNIGYIQGMCDLVAPLLVIFDDEPLTYSCFKQLMTRMSLNFPHGTAMDEHFSNMRNLIQILDTDLFEHMHHRGDYTHFYFSYRWFLLDFKRELVYDDVFSVWETIWSARHISSKHFHLFIALALVETYRDIIIENNMDFTDIIKFFNGNIYSHKITEFLKFQIEMAEKHKIVEILDLARNLINQLQNLIENKNDINIDEY